MKKVLSIFFKKSFLSPLALLLITIFVCIQNYVPQTFLSGWDTLHPEFNFNLNLQRTLFGVFRIEQGLGAIAAHAHMVEIPRIILLQLLDIPFSTSFLRYAYIFLCLIFGPIGMYWYLKYITKKEIPSFLGGLFYLLNLGTLQTFIVPFEMFTTLYATLPYIFLSTTLYLKDSSIKHLAYVAIAFVLTIPAAYASTLWYVFFMFYLLFFVPQILFIKNKKEEFKKYLLLFITIICVNSYWILPNIYFALNSTTEVTQANINKLFSEEAFLKNKEFGTIDNVLLLKSFYFDWNIYSFENKNFEQLTLVFQNHLENPFIKGLGYFFAALFTIGVFYFVKIYKKKSIGILLALIFCLFFVINDNPPFSPIFRLAQENLPLFKEALRFPGNKIENVFIFLITIFFAYFFVYFESLIKLVKPVLKKPLLIFITILIPSLLVLYMLPVFNGNLIHKTMKVTIPIEYFEMFDYLGKNPHGRVANLPIHSPFGWVYYDWYPDKPSFQGAAFLYFGTPQSLMDRDFDRWNKSNEQYYKELSHAVYANDISLFKKVLEKYNITHLFLDTSVINPGSSYTQLGFDNISNLIGDLLNEGYISDQIRFGEKLSIYELNSTPNIKTLSQAAIISSYQTSFSIDENYNKFGNYISSSDNSSTLLASFFDNDSKVFSDAILRGNGNIELLINKNTYEIIDNNITQQIIPATIIGNKTTDGNQEVLEIEFYPLTPLFDKTQSLGQLKGSFEIDENINTLSVNNNVYSLSTLSYDSPTTLGTVFLSSGNNRIALYDSSSLQNISLETLPIRVSYCNINANSSDIFFSQNSNEITIEKQSNIPVCIFTEIFAEQNQTTLYTLSYNTLNNAYIQTCLSEIGQRSCQNNLFNSYQQGKTISSAAISNPSQLIIRLESDQDTIKLSDLRLTSNQATSQSTINEGFFRLTIPHTFETISIPDVTDEYSVFRANPNITTQNDCGQNPNASKEFVNSTEPYILYKAQTGSFCDHFSFENLSHNASYLVFVRYENDEGLPMNICITNHSSRRCDIYAKLTKTSGINEDIFFLPKSDTNGKGYDVNFETLGIKGSPSQNKLYSITFIPFPYEILKNIYTKSPIEENFTSNLESFENYAQTNSIIRLTDGNALVTNSLAFDKGFIMFEVGSSNILNRFLPFIFGKKIDNHVVLNSYANTWTFEANSDSVYIIYYLPQLLQLSGLIASFSLFLFIFISIIKSHSFPRFRLPFLSK